MYGTGDRHIPDLPTWLLLGLAVESPWSALDESFLSSVARMVLENGFLAM